MEIDIGIPEADRRAIADGLSKVLADTYTLYLKTHNFHWNVTGPQFNTLHAMFMTQYTELSVAVDDIAERIHSWAGSQRVRRKHMQALHAVGHSAGTDAVDFGNVAQLRSLSKVGLMCLAISGSVDAPISVTMIV